SGGVRARGVVRLLDDAPNTPVAVELRYAEVAQVLRVGLAREQNARATLLRDEPVGRGAETALDDVVGEHHADAVPVDEALCQAQRLGDPARLLLVPVGEQFEPVLVAVAEQAEEL